MRKKPPIDLEDLLERVSGNTDFANSMLEMFFKGSQDRINVMKDQLEKGQFEELSDHAHKMKGVVGNLSIPETFNQLAELHHITKAQNPAEAARLLNEIEQSIEDAYLFYLAYPIVSK